MARKPLMYHSASAAAFVMAVLLLCHPTAAAEPNIADVLEDAGFECGIVVQLGCGEPQRLLEIGRQGQYVVQALDRDPDTVAEEMLRYHDELGINHIIMSCQGVGMPQTQVLETFDLLAKEVFPKVRAAL